MKPVRVSKAGKSRRQVPDASTLKELGLRVKAAPPEAPNPCLETAPASDGESGLLDVMREDAPVIAKRDAALDKAVAAPKPTRKRVPRVRVSAATHGGVPVQLGGRTLPTSILSRREYGMRLLKR
jgi:hypothetical protein